MKAVYITGHGGDIYSRQRPVRYDFSANINPLGLPETVKAELASIAAVCPPYPDPSCLALVEVLAEYEQVNASYILCGNGAADLIYRIAYGIRPQHILLPAPTFSEYEQAVKQAGGKVSYHDLTADHGFALEDTFLTRLEADQMTFDMIFLCNPNNPTGKLIDPDLLLRTLKCCAKKQITVVIDECFLDFVGEEARYTLKPQLSLYPNLIILKAFTKFFAMAGMRLGYLMTSDPSVRDRIFHAGQPWSVSTVAQRCGIAALSDISYQKKTKSLIQKEREFLYYSLCQLGIDVFEGTANFLFFHIDDTDFAPRMADKGILVRDCSNYVGLSSGYYRVAVRGRAENEALIQAIRELQEEKI